LAAPTWPGEASTGDLIDWPPARDAALAHLRRTFAALAPEDRRALDDEARRQPALWRHALFDALHLRHGALPWQDWPAAFRAPSSDAVHAFAHDSPDEIALHIFGQVKARRKLAAAQKQARDAGMKIGLIADL